MIKPVSTPILVEANETVRIDVKLKKDAIGASFAIECANPGGFWTIAAVPPPSDVVGVKALQINSVYGNIGPTNPDWYIDMKVQSQVWVRVCQYLKKSEKTTVTAKAKVKQNAYKKFRRFVERSTGLRRSPDVGVERE